MCEKRRTSGGARGRSLKFMSRTAEYKFLRGSPTMRPRKFYKLACSRKKLDHLRAYLSSYTNLLHNFSGVCKNIC